MRPVGRLVLDRVMDLPVNAPKCPMAHFQQDGHMAVGNPVARASYEPNSWDVSEGGPREDPATGFRSYPAQEGGEKRRLRAGRPPECAR